MTRHWIRSAIAQLISLPSALAACLGGAIAYSLLQNVFPESRWPWIGGILFWLTFSIPIYAMIQNWIEKIARTDPSPGNEDAPADYRDLVTLWIVATILAIGWVGIYFRGPLK